MLYVLPIEPYKERYTDWWIDYFNKKLEELKIEHTLIQSDRISDVVSTGTVLDAAGTNYYKSVQLKIICQFFKYGKIKPNDTFLVCDIWFPGIEMIRYMSDLYKIPVKIYGIWHAGSITIGDFAAVMHSWSKYFEIGFINMCDGIFVGSDYSKMSILNRLVSQFPMTTEEYEKIERKIYAYGMPLDINYLINKYFLSPMSNDLLTGKTNTIVFPHRPDIEKGINIYLDIIEAISERIPEIFAEWTFTFCTSKKEYKSSNEIINNRLNFLKKQFPHNIMIREDIDKGNYYYIMMISKIFVSTTIEENFGYCLCEALGLNVFPIVENNFSHTEILENKQECLFNSTEEAVEKLINKMSNYVEDEKLCNLVKPYENTIEKWVEIMGVN